MEETAVQQVLTMWEGEVSSLYPSTPSGFSPAIPAQLGYSDGRRDKNKVIESEKDQRERI